MAQQMLKEYDKKFHGKYVIGGDKIKWKIKKY